MHYLFEMKNITKKFPGVTALDNVNFELFPAEVHVLLGENGAGKTTLIKILGGIYEPSKGEIIIGDKKYLKLTPDESIENNIAIIHQELSVIEELSILENIFLGKLPLIEGNKLAKVLGLVDFKKITEKAKELLKKVELDRDPLTTVEELSVSEKQLVEIAKVLASDAKIIVMDEPTSSLTIEETDNLFRIIRELKSEGVGIVYISHRLSEIKKIGDRVSVLKDGKYVATRDAKSVTIEEMVKMMVGRELNYKYSGAKHQRRGENEIIFKVENLTRLDEKVKNINFELFRGEILGFAGLIGSGRTELVEAIFGADRIKSGKIYLFGKELKIDNPYKAIKEDIALITEDRRETGLFNNFNIWKNISIIPLIKESRLGGLWGLLNTSREKEYANKQKDALDIKCASIDQNITDISGGNQQKVIVGKWLASQAKLFIFDEPTKGIDVGAKNEIYQIMHNLVEKGSGIIMVSSELPELLTICDRIIVFKGGEIQTVFNIEEATEEKIMFAAALAEDVGNSTVRVRNYEN